MDGHGGKSKRSLDHTGLFVGYGIVTVASAALWLSVETASRSVA